MEILIDVFRELHSLLRTRIPDAWDFIDIEYDNDLNAILNDFTYFSAYIAFLVWFVKLFISRLEEILGRRLEVGDKFLIAVVSMVSAMNVLWPFLLFLTHFFTCSFYAWLTAAIVFILNISLFVESLRRFCDKIYSVLFTLPIYLIRTLSFGLFHSAQELANRTGLFEGRESEESAVGPSTTPVIQPRIDGEYRPSERPVLQPRLTHEAQIGPSQRPVIQPRKAEEDIYSPSKSPRIQPRLIPEKPQGPSENSVTKSQKTHEETYRPSERPRIQPRPNLEKPLGPSEEHKIQPQKLDEEIHKPSDTPRIQPRLILDKTHGPSETPVIQPRGDTTELHKASQEPRIQPRIDHISSQREWETPRMHSKTEGRQSYRLSEVKGKHPRIIRFGAKESNENKSEIENFIDDPGLISMISGKSELTGKTEVESSQQKTKDKKLDCKICERIQYKDFKHQLDMGKEEKKISTPKQYRFKRST